jgi:hypothetical protein
MPSRKKIKGTPYCALVSFIILSILISKLTGYLFYLLALLVGVGRRKKEEGRKEGRKKVKVRQK